MIDSKKDQLIMRIENRISSITGLKINARNREKLKAAIANRMEVLGILDIGLYALNILRPSLELTGELKDLIELIVNTETYFFRDKNLFHLLQTTLLPEIINRNASKKKIYLWSAGCSSGEEVFSLIICLLQLLPDWKKWSIKVMGTDISETMLDAAKRGYYTKNSLRSLKESLQQRYFIEKDNQMEILSQLKEIVTFKHLNLMTNFNLDSEFTDIDLIICRNVFIYFNEHSIKTVVGRFSNALAANGILICGHGELIGITHPLYMERMEEGMIFRKKELL